MTKTERTRQKLASLQGYFKKEPGSYIWNRDEALAYMADAMLYLMFLIEELSEKFEVAVSKKNNIYHGGKNESS